MEKLNKVLQLTGVSLNAIGSLHFYTESMCMHRHPISSLLSLYAQWPDSSVKKFYINRKISDTTGNITSLKEFARFSDF